VKVNQCTIQINMAEDCETEALLEGNIYLCYTFVLPYFVT